MKDKIEEFNKNTYLVFVLIIKELIEIIKPFIFNMEENLTMSEYYYNYDWFGFVTNITIVVLLFIVLKRYQKLRYQTYMQSKMLSVKMKYYDIIHTKFLIDNPSHPTSLYEKDLGWFDEEEKKLLDNHIKQIEKVKNTIQGIGR